MTCCYLCKSSFECSLKQGGVFVPLQEHFEQFCLTDNFAHCEHYMEFAAACGKTLPVVQENSIVTNPQRDRRCFARQKAEFPVALSSCVHMRTSIVASQAKIVAHTVDFSQGGMKVRAAGQIVGSGMLLFSFGEGFIAPLLHGFAEVCWQKVPGDSHCWEAGLSFRDQFVKALIAVQMSI